MTTLVPTRSGRLSLTPRQYRHVERDQRHAELAVYQHGLAAATQAAMDRLDAQAAADAVQASLEEELALLDYGLHRASGSAAKTELVARKVQLLSALNDCRITRHFGR